MQDHDAEALAAARGIVFEPGARGCWEALEAVTGASQELEDGQQARRHAGIKSRSKGYTPL